MSNAAALLFEDLPRARDPTLYICHSVGEIEIDQRRSDGYINATAMCRAYGKRFSNYSDTDTFKKFLAALSSNTGIPALELVQSAVGGAHMPTWVHPRYAIRLAISIDADFAVLVTGWVEDWWKNGFGFKDAVNPFLGKILDKLDETHAVVSDIDERTKRIEATGLETWVCAAQAAHNGSVYTEQLALELPPTPQAEQPERQPRGTRGQPIPKLVGPREK